MSTGFEDARDADLLDARNRGACIGLDPMLFFPGQGDDATVPRMVCQSCPVLGQCLEYALRHEPGPGVVGGEGITGRRKLRQARDQRRALALAEAVS